LELNGNDGGRLSHGIINDCRYERHAVLRPCHFRPKGLLVRLRFHMQKHLALSDSMEPVGSGCRADGSGDPLWRYSGPPSAEVASLFLPILHATQHVLSGKASAPQ
jgi:hypothetical protein